MAVTTTSPPSGISLGSQTVRRLAYTTTLPKRTSCVFQQNKTRKLKYGNGVRHHFVSSCLMDDSVSSLHSSSNHPSEMIKNFYRCINDKNLKALGNHISEDCLIEDSLFIEPFEGKKEALQFFQELTQSMGQDVKFKIHNVYERGTSGAGAIWHLAWKDIEIPFTKGCTFIDIREREKTIQKAQIIIEPQIKAGHFFLALLKLVTLLIATFPVIPEWLLEVSKLRWVKWILKICIALFKLILRSIPETSLTIFYYGVQLYSYAFKISQIIINLFK